MSERAVFFISDQTGVTAETLGHSLITQFAGQNFRQSTLPFIDTEDKAREAVRTIDEAAKSDALRPIVFSTMVQPNLREIVRCSVGLYLDLFDEFLDPLAAELGTQPNYEPGRAHGLSDIDAYMKRIEATNFALANDDGGISRNYDVADVILIGVSRSGKTLAGFPPGTKTEAVWIDHHAGASSRDSQGTSPNGTLLVSATGALRIA
jgi:regulator of PEP synthase PpsR (kinase-PPPase family)